MALVLPELSYQIIGLSYKVFNSLGYGHQEKIYQSAYAQELLAEKIPFKREVYVPIEYRDIIIGKGFIDFLIDDKIVVEFKVMPAIKAVHFRQVLEYLRVTDKELAIIIFFTKNGVHSKRVLNPHKQ